MAKSTFTPAQKAQAISMLIKGTHITEVAEEIGCSVASLNIWKKDYREGKISLDDMDDDEQKASAKTQSHVRTVSREGFVKRYWQTKSVDTVMKMPETIDEVVKLINDALSYAYDELT